MTKNDMKFLVRGLEKANSIYLFDSTLQIILDETNELLYVENSEAGGMYMCSLLVRYCKEKKLVLDRIIESGKVN